MTSSRDLPAKLLGIVLLAVALAAQVGLAMLIDMGLTRLWSGTASPLRLIPHFSIAVLLTLAAMTFQYLRFGAEGSIMRHWRWFGVFWVMALLATCAVGG